MGGIEVVSLVPDNIDDLSDYDFERGIKEQILSKELFKNKIISDDGRESWILLRLKPTPKNVQDDGPHVEYLIGSKVLEIIRRAKYAPLTPKAAGMAVVDVEKRLYFGQVTPKLILMSVIIVAIGVALATRNWRVVIFPLLVSVMALMGVLGFLGHLRLEFDPITIFLPIFLTMAMSTCYTVHILNFFNAKMDQNSPRRAAILYAAEKTGWSLLSSALTTIAGLVSFVAIPLKPIRFVGLTAALLVAATFVLVYVLLPIYLSLGSNKVKSGSSLKQGFSDRLVDFLGKRVLNRPRLTMVVFLGVSLIVLIGATKLEVSFDVRQSYGTKVAYIKRMFEISDSKVGSLYSYGIAIELDAPDKGKDPKVLKNLKILENEISSWPLTKKVSSLVPILEDLNQVLNDGQKEYLKLPETTEEVAQMLLLYENAGGREPEKWIDYDYQSLKISVEVSDYNSMEILKNMRAINKRTAELFPLATVTVTGSLPQFTVMLEYVTWGQVKTFFLALLAITLVMVITFRSLKIALLALIPNALPALTVSGFMGWLNIPLDVMTVTIVPMLLGLAVDDTIHFINHSAKEFKIRGDYKEAIYLTEKSVGKAIILTSVILILAFSSYLTADIKVFVYLGVLIGLGVLTALLADLLVTPVLLKIFKAFGPEK
ncbi:MAG: MMPL family transporter [Deltaproteobacteria bacterium]|nr:MMPL family transporter [Deltaproteobacteria bacterium]